MARRPLALLALLGLVLLGLSLTAGGCEADAAEVKAAVQGYYHAVAQGNAQGQEALWLPESLGQANSEAEAWAQRQERGLQLLEVHIAEGPAQDQRLAHVTLSLEDRVQSGKRRYESETLLLQRFEGEWRIRAVLP